MEQVITKSRAIGQTTTSQEYRSHAKPVETEEVPEETVKLLQSYHREFQKQVSGARGRHQRIERLMIRKSAANWSIEKRAKMIRRHTDALSQADQAEKMLDQVTVRLQQLTHTA